MRIIFIKFIILFVFLFSLGSISFGQNESNVIELDNKETDMAIPVQTNYNFKSQIDDDYHQQCLFHFMGSFEYNNYEYDLWGDLIVFSNFDYPEAQNYDEYRVNYGSFVISVYQKEAEEIWIGDQYAYANLTSNFRFSKDTQQNVHYLNNNFAPTSIVQIKNTINQILEQGFTVNIKINSNEAKSHLFIIDDQENKNKFSECVNSIYKNIAYTSYEGYGFSYKPLEEKGLLIDYIYPESNLNRLGIKVGDIITSVNNKSLMLKSDDEISKLSDSLLVLNNLDLTINKDKKNIEIQKSKIFPYKNNFEISASKKINYSNEIDTNAPIISIKDEITINDEFYKLKGKISDESLAFLEAEGKQIEIFNDNTFFVKGYVPVGERFINLRAIDEWGNETKKSCQNY